MAEKISEKFPDNEQGMSAADKFAVRPVEWYSSPEGEAAFNETDGQKEKMLFFYSYLWSLHEKAVRSSNNKDERQRHMSYVAFLMAYIVYGSDLKFSSYQDLLDPTKNPLLTLEDIGGDCSAGAVLRKLLTDENQKDLPAGIPLYKRLTYEEQTCLIRKNISTQYKLERAFIHYFLKESPYKLDLLYLEKEDGKGE